VERISPAFLGSVFFLCFISSGYLRPTPRLIRSSSVCTSSTRDNPECKWALFLFDPTSESRQFPHFLCTPSPAPTFVLLHSIFSHEENTRLIGAKSHSIEPFLSLSRSDLPHLGSGSYKSKILFLDREVWCLLGPPSSDLNFERFEPSLL